MLAKKFNTLQLLITTLIGSSLTMIICYRIAAIQNTEEVPEVVTGSSQTCEIVTHRLQGYKYVKPILYNDRTCESGNYNVLKGNLENTIRDFTTSGEITKASVYLKMLNSREFIGINETEKFHPASLIKLPMLIAYLKMDEQNPGFLNRKLVYKSPLANMPKQTFNSKQIQIGKSYTIKELLTYMVAYSDNNATKVLNDNVDLNLLKKMFADLGLSVPDVTDMNYSISPKDFSLFLNVVYNGSYISVQHSEFVAEILNKSDFKIGIVKGIPNDVGLIHKFGEWGSFNEPKIHQLSESAIVYMDNNPYLITIMTEGKDVQKLPNVISRISAMVYHNLNDSESQSNL